MSWILIAVKGSADDYSYFKNNQSLATYLKQRGLTVLSTMDWIDPNDPQILEPVHAFLRFYYPFYSQNPAYSDPDNEISRTILSSFSNPAYMDFFFKELKITGSNGPYAIVFNGHQILIKYLGVGRWTEYGLYSYFTNTEIFPPSHWPEEWISKSQWTPTRMGLSDSQDISGIQGNSFSDASLNLPKDVFSVDLLENSLQEELSSANPEVLRLLQMIRENNLQRGFQDLLQWLGTSGNALSPRNLGYKPQPVLQNPFPNIRITSEYRMFFPYGELTGLEPLHKSVYLLFLKYPEGISLYDIASYKNTLWHIYENVSNAENVTAMRERVDRLTNRFDNSLYEKISRINSQLKRELLQRQIDHSVFSILGQRGQPKKVLAAQDLVIWEV